jgi:hypothetical protein
MSDIRTVESAYLMATARWKRMMAQVVQDFFRPYTDLQVVAFWRSLSDEQKGKMPPDMVAEIERKVATIEKGG